MINSESDWDSIRDDWDKLFSASPYAATALDFAWLRGWWRVYGQVYGADGLRILTMWRSSSLVGALPLYLKEVKCFPFPIRKLMFVSTGEAEFEEVCPDYLGILCSPGDEEECVRSAWREIGGLAWDCLEFLDVAADSPLLKPDALPKRAAPFSRGSCPIADLTGGFEVYLGRLSPNSRQQARRLIREGEQAGVQFVIADADRVEEVFADLVSLHQQRWVDEGKTGVFSAQRFAEFHCNLISQWLPQGRAILAHLSLAGEAVAVLYGFVNRDKFDFYQSGVKAEGKGPLRSPGNLAHLLLMRELTERGVTAYDFLRGSASYKQRLATREQALAGLKIWRRTGRAAACRCALLARRVVRASINHTLGRVLHH